MCSEFIDFSYAETSGISSGRKLDCSWNMISRMINCHCYGENNVLKNNISSLIYHKLMSEAKRMSRGDNEHLLENAVTDVMLKWMSNPSKVHIQKPYEYFKRSLKLAYIDLWRNQGRHVRNVTEMSLVWQTESSSFKPDSHIVARQLLWRCMQALPMEGSVLLTLYYQPQLLNETQLQWLSEKTGLKGQAIISRALTCEGYAEWGALYEGCDLNTLSADEAGRLADRWRKLMKKWTQKFKAIAVEHGCSESFELN